MAEEDEHHECNVGRSRFTQSLHARKLHRQREGWSPLRLKISRVVSSTWFDALCMFIIIVNMGFIVVEANASARGQLGTWTKALNLSFIGAYCIEIALRIFVARSLYFESTLNLIDLGLVLMDALFQIVMEALVGAVPTISVLRVFKTIRLVRVIRAFSGFRELWLMLHGFAAAMRAMFWASILIGVVLIIWSVVSVELLNDVVQTLDSEGAFEDCGMCKDSFSSVESAMLTWFVVVFAGDLWSDLVIPVLTRRPFAALIIFPTFFCIQFGMLNLILTVIVDRASQARADDREQQVFEKKCDFSSASRQLAVLCEAMDIDGSGNLSLQEIVTGYEDIDEFGQLLKVMDVGPHDLDMVFQILDKDRSGTVSYREFIDELHKMKSQESHTMLVFIKHYVQEMRESMMEFIAAESVGTVNQTWSAGSAVEPRANQVPSSMFCSAESAATPRRGDAAEESLSQGDDIRSSQTRPAETRAAPRGSYLDEAARECELRPAPVTPVASPGGQSPPRWTLENVTNLASTRPRGSKRRPQYHV